MSTASGTAKSSFFAWDATEVYRAVSESRGGFGWAGGAATASAAAWSGGGLTGRRGRRLRRNGHCG